ncbi:hypothetical protein XENTR_v10006688 [Xenopus tropicalis]|nr:hypothetical protein XENTR_v10006688 [Xenopus tropicalis]KAE8626630.1 hypothetical protein XENTR_v10006688 [Xenopus tropicalis]
MWWILSSISRQAKKHPGLIPLIGFTGLGITNAALYLVKLTLFNPDISWVKKKEPEPWYKLD